MWEGAADAFFPQLPKEKRELLQRILSAVDAIEELPTYSSIARGMGLPYKNRVKFFLKKNPKAALFVEIAIMERIRAVDEKIFLGWLEGSEMPIATSWAVDRKVAEIAAQTARKMRAIPTDASIARASGLPERRIRNTRRANEWADTKIQKAAGWSISHMQKSDFLRSLYVARSEIPKDTLAAIDKRLGNLIVKQIRRMDIMPTNRAIGNALGITADPIVALGKRNAKILGKIQKAKEERIMNMRWETFRKNIGAEIFNAGEDVKKPALRRLGLRIRKEMLECKNMPTDAAVAEGIGLTLSTVRMALVEFPELERVRRYRILTMEKEQFLGNIQMSPIGEARLAIDRRLAHMAMRAIMGIGKEPPSERKVGGAIGINGSTFSRMMDRISGEQPKIYARMQNVAKMWARSLKQEDFFCALGGMCGNWGWLRSIADGRAEEIIVPIVEQFGKIPNDFAVSKAAGMGVNGFIALKARSKKIRDALAKRKTQIIGKHILAGMDDGEIARTIGDGIENVRRARAEIENPSLIEHGIVADLEFARRAAEVMPSLFSLTYPIVHDSTPQKFFLNANREGSRVRVVPQMGAEVVFIAVAYPFIETGGASLLGAINSLGNGCGMIFAVPREMEPNETVLEEMRTKGFECKIRKQAYIEGNNSDSTSEEMAFAIFVKTQEGARLEKLPMPFRTIDREKEKIESQREKLEILRQRALEAAKNTVKERNRGQGRVAQTGGKLPATIK